MRYTIYLILLGICLFNGIIDNGNVSPKLIETTRIITTIKTTTE